VALLTIASIISFSSVRERVIDIGGRFIDVLPSCKELPNIDSSYYKVSYLLSGIIGV
jgi:hypothetical protein